MEKIFNATFSMSITHTHRQHYVLFSPKKKEKSSKTHCA